MTVALFATTSGGIVMLRRCGRPLLVREDDLTKVTFYFQQGLNLYRIERILQQERAKRGGGTTIQKATASLVIVDKIGGQEIEKLGDKIKEVSDQIEQIFGSQCRAVQTDYSPSQKMISARFLKKIPRPRLKF